MRVARGRAIDRERFLRLESWGGEALVRQLVESFIRETPGRIAVIRAVSGAEDAMEGERMAHSLRSTALNLGAVDLATVAEEAESALKSAEWTALPELGERLLSSFEAAAAELRSSPPEAHEPEEEVGVKPKIAVVEDNPDNRLLVQALLGDRYEIDEYETGIRALEELPTNPVEVVLLDISLPEMDGTEVLTRLREIPELSHVPVVALTAHAMAGDRERFLSLGFNDYVTKPIVDEELLIQAIERWRSPVV
jgi:two-component system cell cycle response regulator DivK